MGEELDVYAVNDIIEQYKTKWHQAVLRMEDNQIPKHALLYRSIGRRIVGWPRKKWTDRLYQTRRPNP